ncbi:MAG: adenylate kinase, partial [Actinobacteria bacterium ATB1]|nr:adenylate kinase [Actinobacteria bacterium ATB1]
MRRIIFIGPPGAGKGTQAERIRDRYDVAWISTGDMFRDAIATRTPMGERAKTFVEAGDLVPDDVVVGMVMERLDRPD